MRKCDFNKVAKPSPHLVIRANAEFNSDPGTKKSVV